MTILPSPSPSLVPDERAMPGADRHAVVGVYQTNRDREVGELLLVELGGGFVVDVGHVCTPVTGPQQRRRRKERVAIGTLTRDDAENSLDFMSAKVQSEENRNANAKRSGFPFQNLIDGTRFSVPGRSFRRRSGQWTPVGELSRGRTLW
jgi:hypothetical protein